MARFQDISLAFDDIIETPLSRRRKVEEASLAAQQRVAQTGGPFATLASGIAGSLPGITENVRTTARDAGLSAFQLPGEKLADQLKNINTNTEAGQRQAVALIQQIDPGRAQALQDHYTQINLDRAQVKFAKDQFAFEQRKQREVERRNKAQEALEARRLTVDEETLDQEIAEFLADADTAENKAGFYRSVAQQFGDNPEVASILQAAATNNVDSAELNAALGLISDNAKTQDKERLKNHLMVAGNMSDAQAQNMMVMLDQGLIKPEVTEDGSILVPNMANIMAKSLGQEMSEEDLVLRIEPDVYTTPNYGIAQEKTLYAQHNFVPGLVNVGLQALQKVFGQVEPQWVDVRLQQAESTVNTIMTGLRAASREEMGAQRLSNALVELIDSEIGLKGKVFDNEVQYLIKLREMNTRLERERIRIASLSTPTQADRTQQSEVLSRVDKALQEIGLRNLIVAPSELSVETIELMSEAQLKESLAAMPNEAYDRLSPEIQAALQKRGNNQ
tara:strand:+ start:966 stop:2480 length:1515 start_codon:yes stop_codon:yes gene_type:complete